MAVYRSNLDGREVKASKGYRCTTCKGWIDRKELYHNYHTDRVDGNWFGRDHFDCQAAWWQGDSTHLLSAFTSQAQDSQLSTEVLVQTLRAQALFADCLAKAKDDPKKALQLSHMIQQMAQVMQVEVKPRNS